MAAFSEDTINAVWNAAQQVEGVNPDLWRKDIFGAWIRRDNYGVHTLFGWEIDHFMPISHGGNDDLDNLNAMQWQNNLQKSDDYPQFESKVTSQGNTNIEKIASWRVRE